MVEDIKLQISLFQNSYFTVTQCQKNPVDCVMVKCVKIGSVVFAVGDDKKKGKERKGTKSHKSVIFHLFVGKPPVNRF